MKVSEGQKLKVFELKCLSSMASVPMLNRIRNEVVGQTISVEVDLATGAERNALRWFGHVERMENERMPKKVMDSRVNGGKAKRSLRLRWMDEVRRGLQDRCMCVRQANERTRDRNE